MYLADEDCFNASINRAANACAAFVFAGWEEGTIGLRETKVVSRESNKESFIVMFIIVYFFLDARSGSILSGGTGIGTKLSTLGKERR